MHSKVLLVALLATVLPQLAGAENPRILEIRNEYNAVAALEARESENSGDGAYTHRVSYRNVMPGTGYRNRVVSYFHQDTPNPDGRAGELLQILRKVTVEDNVSAVRFRSEYLFDAEGSLLFYFQREEGFPGGEERFYFSGGELIRVVMEPLGKTDDPRYMKFRGDEDFPLRFTAAAYEIKRQAAAHLEMFRLLLEHQFID